MGCYHQVYRSAEWIAENGVGVVGQLDVSGTLGTNATFGGNFTVAVTAFGDNELDYAFIVNGNKGMFNLGDCSNCLNSAGMAGGASGKFGFVIGDASDLVGQNLNISVDGLLLQKLPRSTGVLGDVRNYARYATKGLLWGASVSMPSDDDGGAYTATINFGRSFGAEATETETIFSASRRDGFQFQGGCRASRLEEC
ncbi:hypothetical protein ABWI01_05515 [Oceanicaulis alexandrii]|uniref:hypothetical protein n=1 Tax=Oceanicaulis alexandrii TaxID=153233 RepID=UPI0035CE99C4